MDRRGYLGTLVTGSIVATAGCAGGEVVHAVNRSVTVPRGQGWISEVPPEADKIKFIVRDDRPFDVFVFTDSADADYYRTFLDGEAPEEEPVGNTDLGGRATQIEEGLYEAKTENSARQDLPGDGPTYFVVDHSTYGRGTMPREWDDPLSASVDLEGVQSTLPL